MDKNEQKICWYSSLLIALTVNSARLMALRENGIIARYWHFDIFEFSFQFLYNLLFSFLLFFLNLSENRFFSIYRQKKQFTKYYLFNALVVVTATVTGHLLQSELFKDRHVTLITGRGYIARFTLTCILVAIIIHLVLLIRENRKKDSKNEKLKNAYLQTQLELLKKQMDPHLLFNSLSSLSGIVREDQKLAQVYIFHLSKVFRNALVYSKSTLVSVSEELDTLKSYQKLISLRLEDAFRVNIEVDTKVSNYQIPHLSLQPLLENAAKHNIATKEKPLEICIYSEGDFLVITNNLQPLSIQENSTGIGLANLHERFSLLTQKEIEIQRTKDLFIVKLPLTI